ncbi:MULTISPECIES: cag pathogenicity island Cag12 family protein [Campylobacter]|uniref:Cag pathogenicity island protein n=3 Tax=Campylobacter TaxID=194 RepID=A0A4U7BC02_9BACT|nr:MULTISPECIES: cag pathogenicity island Cag12 family protein [Campylobacter]TKX28908.1 cag pathogenicity island protein [Campylobacter estrildidarum]TKX29174.1 cag pathogenicity island protein [Campylobacter aviculae]TKX33434.1 cag pathogenicity island protein [Campylobacter taeniopygiae]
MTKKSLSSLAFMAFVIVGCSAPKPMELDNSSALAVNNSILEKKYNFVPKDPYLSGFNWTYHIVVEKKTINDDFIKNDLITKTFLLAHNATRIILVGREDLIEQYKQYFKKNQVLAPIELQPVDPIEEDFNKVNILFFNKTNF